MSCSTISLELEQMITTSMLGSRGRFYYCFQMMIMQVYTPHFGLVVIIYSPINPNSHPVFIFKLSKTLPSGMSKKKEKSLTKGRHAIK